MMDLLPNFQLPQRRPLAGITRSHISRSVEPGRGLARSKEDRRINAGVSLNFRRGERSGPDVGAPFLDCFAFGSQ
jgi:hypothetical protein